MQPLKKTVYQLQNHLVHSSSGLQDLQIMTTVTFIVLIKLSEQLKERF